MNKIFLQIAIASLFLVGVFSLLWSYSGSISTLKMFAALPWVVILLFLAFAIQRQSLAAWIMVGMVAGAEFGHIWPAAAVKAQVLGTIFLRLVKVIIAPLIFGTLVVGIAGHGDLRKVGRIAVKALIYFELVSTLALVIGFVAIHLTQAGSGIQLPTSVETHALDSASPSASDLIINIFPENIARSVAEGQIVQVVVFSVLFGFALAMVPLPKRQPLIAFTSSLSETMLKFTNVVMFAAPIGVFGAVAFSVGHLGMEVLLPLVKLLATMYAALAVFVLIVLLPIALVAQVPLRLFMKAVTEPLTIAFATASSEAALPLAIDRLEALGISRETVALVLPAGYSFNLDGSSLYQSIALMFVAQAAGMHIGFREQITMLLVLLVSSKGTAGVARASLVVVLAVSASFHFSLEPVFLLFGIDHFMDMARTAVNVLGNCLATVVIARWEGDTFLAKMN